MQKELESAYQLAEENAEKINAGNKRKYDQRLYYSHLVPGDKVLIGNLGLHGKHNIEKLRHLRQRKNVVKSQSTEQGSNDALAVQEIEARADQTAEESYESED